MSKVSIENVEAILLDRKIDQPTVTAIIKDLEQSIEEEKEDREANKLPQKKWEYIVYLNDPEGKITGDFDAWIATYLEGTDAATVLQKLRDGAKEQNEAAKRKKNKLTTLGEVFQGIKTKFIKDKGVKVKTKESVRVIPVNGKQF